MPQPRQSEFDSRADRLLLRHVYFKSNESSEFDNFDGSEIFVDNSLLFDELGQRAIILQAKFANNRVQQFKQPPLLDELSQRASLLQPSFVSNRDKFEQHLLTFVETDSELEDLIVEQPHPLQHFAVVDEVTSESESTGCEFWSPRSLMSLPTMRPLS
jgi:hypothetical protein